MTFEWLALGAACCWAVGSLSAAPASSHLGAVAFTRWRLLFAASLLSVLAWAHGGWHTLSAAHAGLFAVSGLVGIFVGDVALFACMNRMGPRRSGVLFATHALFSAALAWWWLGERLSAQVAVGAGLMVLGVMLAVALGKRADETHAWEQVKGRWWVGVALGLLAALCQALATLMVKPALSLGQIDPVAASAVRMLAALLAHGVWRLSGMAVTLPVNRITQPVLRQVIWNAALSQGLGMTLVIVALQGGSAGLVAVLSSVTPVVLLPLLWVVYRRRPAPGAWAGALLTVAGGALVLTR